MITPRSDFGADTINGIIYAAGGSDGSSPALATLEAYDPTSDSWTTLASMPTPRADLAVLAFNGLLYAIGGRGADGSPLATVEAYDPTADSWATEPSMPTARWGLAALVAPNNLASPDEGVEHLGAWRCRRRGGRHGNHVVEVFVPAATPTPMATPPRRRRRWPASSRSSPRLSTSVLSKSASEFPTTSSRSESPTPAGLKGKEFRYRSSSKGKPALPTHSTSLRKLATATTSAREAKGSRQTVARSQ